MKVGNRDGQDIHEKSEAVETRTNTLPQNGTARGMACGDKSKNPKTLESPTNLRNDGCEAGCVGWVPGPRLLGVFVVCLVLLGVGV